MQFTISGVGMKPIGTRRFSTFGLSILKMNIVESSLVLTNSVFVGLIDIFVTGLLWGFVI